MHDCFGREVHAGDYVKFKVYGGGDRKQVAAIEKISPGSTTCNATAVYLVLGRVEATSVTLKECELVAMADGSDPPTGE